MIQFSGDRYVPKTNVSAEADRAYCEEKGILQTKSYEEWTVDPPNSVEVAGRAKIDNALRHGTTEEWASAIVEYASSDASKRSAKVIQFPSDPFPGGARYCANDSNGKHILPPDARTNAQYCDQACKQAAYRFRGIAKS